MRLDRLLSEMNIASRREIKESARKGQILVNGQVVKDSGAQVSETDTILYHGQPVLYRAFEYYMMNKPAGVITATEDRRQKTVLDLLYTDDSETWTGPRRDVAPVGRLDKDTTGLLLLTNDGALAHRLLAPGKHVDKVYSARIRGQVTQKDVEAFAAGLQVEEDWRALPADLEILSTYDGASLQIDGICTDIRITIREGKYHQIKRMFAAVGKEVLTLKRESMGPLVLDPALSEGQWRPLTPEEEALLLLRGE